MLFVTADEAGPVRVSPVCFVSAERCEADAGTLTVHDETGNVIDLSRISMYCSYKTFHLKHVFLQSEFFACV